MQLDLSALEPPEGIRAIALDEQMRVGIAMPNSTIRLYLTALRLVEHGKQTMVRQLVGNFAHKPAAPEGPQHTGITSIQSSRSLRNSTRPSTTRTGKTCTGS